MLLIFFKFQIESDMSRVKRYGVYFSGGGGEIKIEAKGR